MSQITRIADASSAAVTVLLSGVCGSSPAHAGGSRKCSRVGTGSDAISASTSEQGRSVAGVTVDLHIEFDNLSNAHADRCHGDRHSQNWCHRARAPCKFMR